LNLLLEQEKAALKELFTWAHGDGGPSDAPSPEGGIGLYWVGKEKRMVRYDKQDSDHIHMVKVLQELGEHTAEQLRKDEGKSLYDHLKAKGVSERAMAFAEAGYANTVGGTLRNISAARMSQCEKNWEKDGDGDFRVVGTLDGVAIAGLARGVDVRCGLPVNKITRVRHGVEVSSARRGGITLSAAAVVVSVPVPVLQKDVIAFSPPLPESKVRAIRSLQCEPALKILAKFTSQFWPADVHGMVCSDSFAPEIWFDTCSPIAPLTAPTYYCTAFYTSDQARHLASVPTTEAFTSLLAQLSEMFGADAGASFAGGFIVDWGQVPYIWGGYTMPSLSETPEARRDLAAPVDGAVFFAGEATDPQNFMTAHAAIDTGIRAAKEAQIAVAAIAKLLPAKL
jgi:monoamine oxidase